MGCVGKDKDAETLEKLLIDNHIVPRYQHSEINPTGECLVLISNHDRSLIAKIAACADFDKSH